ncbi:MAG: hypothetical protein GY861_08230 [bacterium]|nr:hypothetical protein [bacterium]
MISSLFAVAAMNQEGRSRYEAWIGALASIGVVVAAIAALQSTKQAKEQIIQQRDQWEAERAAFAKPLFRYEDVYYYGNDQLRLEVTNEGRAATSLFALITKKDGSKSDPYEDEWSLKNPPIKNSIVGKIAFMKEQSPFGSYSWEQNPTNMSDDIKSGEPINIFFEAPEYNDIGIQFWLVLGYWDLEGRAYKAVMEFFVGIPEDNAEDEDEVSKVIHQSSQPPRRVQNDDRR